MTLRFFMFSPYRIMEAQVDQASFTYPIAEVTMDNVSTSTDPGGDWQYVRAGMTVEFWDPTGSYIIGRQRLRKNATATTLYFGRSSQGSLEGLVDLVEDAIIYVYVDYRVWGKIPYIDTGTDPPTVYMDHDIAAGTNVLEPPPKANPGEPAIGDIDAVSGFFRVTLPHETNTSRAVADGATITSYEWGIPDTGWLVGGSVVTDPQITLDVPPGAYWISLEVTDSNAKTHQAWVLVVARDPANPIAHIDEFEILRHESRQDGSELDVKVTQDISTGLPDGTLVILYNGNPSSPTDRSNIEFWGWHQANPQKMYRDKTGLATSVTLECVDVIGRLKHVKGYSYLLSGDSNNVEDWAYMPNADWLKKIYYGLHWMSTALDVADFEPSTELANYPFVVHTVQAGTVYDQIKNQAEALCPDFKFTCTRGGKLLIRVDPMLVLPANRSPEVVATLGEDEYSSIGTRSKYWPGVAWVRQEAVRAHATSIESYKSVAPGDAPGQGIGQQDPGKRLAQSQAQLNETTGQYFGRVNAPEEPYDIKLVAGDAMGIDPAVLRWVNVYWKPEYAAQRGLTFSNERGLPLSLSFTYHHTRNGWARTIDLKWEREVQGIPGVTFTTPDPGA